MQVEWLCPNQLRANTQRDWLALQLQGRGFVADVPPFAELNPLREVWVTRCDVAFDTVLEGQTIQTLALARQAADPFIQAGSWTQHHDCPHDDGLNSCVDTLTRTVK